MIIESINTSDNSITVKLHGEMDALGCMEIRPELEKIATIQNKHSVALDLSRISFLDSSGIGAIVFLYKRLKARECALEITGVHGQPQELIELLRIGNAIPVREGSVSPPTQNIP